MSVTWKDVFAVTKGGETLSEAEVTSRTDFFKSCGVPEPDDADGFTEDDITWTQLTEPAVGAFMRRAFRNALAVVEAPKKVARTSGPETDAAPVSQAPYQSPAVTGMLEVAGPAASGMTVAQVLAHGDKVCAVEPLLEPVGLKDLPFHLRPDMPLWQLLMSENTAAAKEGRTPFSYVELTAKALMPMWLPHDVIGGSDIMSSDWALDPRAPVATVGASRTALKAATQGPRFFRFLAQWNAVHMRMLVSQ